MRKVFETRRIETIEGLVDIMNQAGIETYVTNPRSYKGNRKRTFSYREDASKDSDFSELWIVHKTDITAARQIMADVGLFDPTVNSDSYLPEHFQVGNRGEPMRRKKPWSENHTRKVLLAIIALLAFGHWLSAYF